MKRSWKTTLAGLFAGLIPIGGTVLTSISTGAPIDWKQIGIGAGLIALGHLAKDKDVTGPSK